MFFRFRNGVLKNLLLGFVCGLIVGIFCYFSIFIISGTFSIHYSYIITLIFVFALIGGVGSVLGVLIKYLRFDSDNCLIWLEEGDVLFDAGKFDDAINFYDKALEKDLGNIDALEGIADAFRELGNYKGALEC